MIPVNLQESISVTQEMPPQQMNKDQKKETRDTSQLNNNRFSVHNESFISLYGFKIVLLIPRAVILLFYISFQHTHTPAHVNIHTQISGIFSSLCFNLFYV